MIVGMRQCFVDLKNWLCLRSSLSPPRLSLKPRWPYLPLSLLYRNNGEKRARYQRTSLSLMGLPAGRQPSGDAVSTCLPVRTRY